MKGVYNIRPLQPKYTYTWDVNKVFKFLITLGENKIIKFNDLAEKTSNVTTDTVRSKM